MIELEKTYNPKKSEEKWYDFWLKKKFFHAEVDKSKDPYTIVIPPPNIDRIRIVKVSWVLSKNILANSDSNKIFLLNIILSNIEKEKYRPRIFTMLMAAHSKTVTKLKRYDEFSGRRAW